MQLKTWERVSAMYPSSPYSLGSDWMIYFREYTPSQCNTLVVGVWLARSRTSPTHRTQGYACLCGLPEVFEYKQGAILKNWEKVPTNVDTPYEDLVKYAEEARRNLILHIESL